MILTKTRIKRSFAKASVTYDSVAELQRSAGRILIKTIDAERLNGCLLDLGCGTGFLTSQLEAYSNHDIVIALDIALSMLQTMQKKMVGQNGISYVCADAEHLPFIDKSIDSVFSNLALQWCGNLGGVFTDIKRVLKPDGQLVFSTFGPLTLHELKVAWATVDNYNHVNTFYTKEQLHHFLNQSGFNNVDIKSTLYVSRYNSVWKLMQELKYLGAHNVIAGRNKKITTKTAMTNMIAAYEKYKLGDKIPATFEVINVIATV